MVVKLIKTKADFDALLKDNNGKLIVVDFFAEWCGPCKMIAPKILEMSKEFENVVFAKVNVDDNEETSESCGISAMPTFLLYKNGSKVAEVVGANEAAIREKIESNN